MGERIFEEKMGTGYKRDDKFYAVELDKFEIVSDGFNNVGSPLSFGIGSKKKVM